MEGGGGGRGRLGGAGLRLPEGAGLTAIHLSVEEDLWDNGTMVKLVRPVTFIALVTLVSLVALVALVKLVQLRPL